MAKNKLSKGEKQRLWSLKSRKRWLRLSRKERQILDYLKTEKKLLKEKRELLKLLEERNLSTEERERVTYLTRERKHLKGARKQAESQLGKIAYQNSMAEFRAWVEVGLRKPVPKPDPEERRSFTIVTRHGVYHT